ncbi:MAG TPA: NifU family protein [Acidimicrobiales bacterium]
MTEDLQGSTSAVEEIQDAPVVDEAEIEARKTALFDLIEMMRPSVRLDGGDLKLIAADYVTGVVEVMLDGACGSCAIAELTLEGGVDRLLKEHLSWVTDVKSGVDETVDPLESAAQGRGAYVPRYY